jgi:hypothetical protein
MDARPFFLVWNRQKTLIVERWIQAFTYFSRFSHKFFAQNLHFPQAGCATGGLFFV